MVNTEFQMRYFVYPDKIILADENGVANGWTPGSTADFSPWSYLRESQVVHPLSELDEKDRQMAVEMKGFNGEADNPNLSVYALPDADLIVGYKENPNCFVRMSWETYNWLCAEDVEQWRNLYGMTMDKPIYAKKVEAIREPVEEGISYSDTDEWGEWM